MKKVLSISVTMEYVAKDSNEFECAYKVTIFDDFDNKSEIIKDEKVAKKEYLDVLKKGGSTEMSVNRYNRYLFNKDARVRFF